MTTNETKLTFNYMSIGDLTIARSFVMVTLMLGQFLILGECSKTLQDP